MTERTRRSRAPVAVLAIGGAVTILATVIATHSANQIVSTRFDAAARDMRTVLARRIDAYSEVLFGLRGLFLTQHTVSGESFNAYVIGENVLGRLPGIQAVEFAPRIAPHDVNQFERSTRANQRTLGSPYAQFTVHPHGASSDLYPVDYLEPLATNERALGFDLASEPARNAALTQARDTGDLAATKPIHLVQEPGHERGFLLFLPLYAQGTPSDTVAERRRHVIGMVLSVFRVDNMLAALGPPTNAHITQIFDVGATEATGSEPFSEAGLLTGATSTVNALHGPISILHRFLDLNVGSRRWRVLLVPEAGFASGVERFTGLVTALACVLLTLLLAFLVFSLARTQSRAVTIAIGMTQDLRSREQELEIINERLNESNKVLRDFTAIASHDMRSPLAAILGYSHLLSEQWDHLPEEIRKQGISTIRRRGEDLVRLVDDLLATSQIEAGTLTPRQDRVDIRAAIQESIGSNSEQHDDITVRCEDGLVAIADRAHVLRIFSNLEQNAFKYGKPPVHDRCGEDQWIRRDSRERFRTGNPGGVQTEDVREICSCRAWSNS
ncbi:MAG: CHASE domain-containing protein [Actinomycetota bacterium]